jgi:hypothetical protein
VKWEGKLRQRSEARGYTEVDCASSFLQRGITGLRRCAHGTCVQAGPRTVRNPNRRNTSDTNQVLCVGLVASSKGRDEAALRVGAIGVKVGRKEAKLINKDVNIFLREISSHNIMAIL